MEPKNPLIDEMSWVLADYIGLGKRKVDTDV
jgi:hypothetical protein